MSEVQKASRITLWKFNTLMSLRTKDRVTQDFVTETFGRPHIANQGASFTTGASTAAVGDFTAVYTRQVTGVRNDLIPIDMHEKLPNCEFLASVANGRIVKGQIPILISTGASDVAHSYSVKSKKKPRHARNKHLLNSSAHGAEDTGSGNEA